jgi:GTP pyrophosphokinase
MRLDRADLFDDEVYVFTPKGEVKTLPPARRRSTSPYAVHTDVGHRTVRRARCNGRIVPLHYRCRDSDIVEILTQKPGRGPSRDWLSSRRSRPRAATRSASVFSRETRGDEAQGPRGARGGAQGQNLPYRKLAGSGRAQRR